MSQQDDTVSDRRRTAPKRLASEAITSFSDTVGGIGASAVGKRAKKPLPLRTQPAISPVTSISRKVLALNIPSHFSTEKEFMTYNTELLRRHGVTFKHPAACGQKIPLLRLFAEVLDFGGYHNVSQVKAWRQVVQRLELPMTNSETHLQVKVCYQKYLLPMEMYQHKDLSDPGKRRRKSNATLCPYHLRDVNKWRVDFSLAPDTALIKYKRVYQLDVPGPFVHDSLLSAVKKHFAVVVADEYSVRESFMEKCTRFRCRE